MNLVLILVLAFVGGLIGGFVGSIFGGIEREDRSEAKKESAPAKKSPVYQSQSKAAAYLNRSEIGADPKRVIRP